MVGVNVMARGSVCQREWFSALPQDFERFVRVGSRVVLWT